MYRHPCGLHCRDHAVHRTGLAVHGALYNGLLDVLDGEKIHIEFIPGSTSSFNTEPTISLAMDYVESNVLLHEMFHALQYYTKGEETFRNSTLNCEIEAQYAQFIYLRSLPEFKAGSKWFNRYLKGRRKDIALLNRALTDSITPIHADIFNLYLEFAIETLKKDPNYSNSDIYKYDDSIQNIATFDLLQELVKNCFK